MDRYTIRKRGEWNLCPVGSDERVRKAFSKWRLLDLTAKFFVGRDAVVDVYDFIGRPVTRMVFSSTLPVTAVAIPRDDCVPPLALERQRDNAE